MRLKEVVDGTVAKFVYANDGQLWYEVEYPDGCIKFGVPFDEVKGAHFGREEKAIHLMRWIRKHIDTYNKRDNQ